MGPIYLLDTNILINHLRGANSPSTEWLLGAIKNKTLITISVLTLYELEKGAHTERHRSEAQKITSQFQKHPVNRQIARRAGELYRSVPKNKQSDRLNIDALIAATAEYFNCDLVTTNKKDFDLFQLKRIHLIGVEILRTP